MIYLVQIISHMELFIQIIPTTYQYFYVLNIEIETRIYNEQATTTFKESIHQITWDEMFASINPQESYSKFLNEILFVYNKSFPLIKKTITAKKHKPWITGN